MKKELTCSQCGATLSEEELQVFDGKVLCDTCFIECTIECDNCGTRIWSNDAEGSEDVILCSHCFDYHYTHCHACGLLIHNDNAYYEDDDDDYPYCHNCFHDIQERPIKNYNYKPEPIFYGSGSLFYGVELEIDKGGEDESNADALIKLANQSSERIYCKHDGSISDGFEIVSHPMNIDYHTNNMNWNALMEKAVSMGYRSHNTATCGLHIHCSRSAFGEDYEKQERAIGRAVYFVERHWQELVKFSRRTPENLNRWSARYSTISDTAEETYSKSKDKRMGRYVALNLENYNTIEFRLFRGTLRYKTFIATLQLVDEICLCAINMTDSEIEEMSWLDFVSRILPKKAELIEYLKEKRLYVNEPLTEGVED